MNKVALLFIVVMGISACTTTTETKQDSGVFPVTIPLLIDTVNSTEYIADIQSVQNVEIRTKIRGHIDNIYVDEGKTVASGQLLFSLSNHEFRQELLKARALLKTANAEFKLADLEMQSVKKLMDKNIVSKTEFEKAQANLDAANAKIEEAKSIEASANLNLSFTEIRAPFEGTINRIPYKIGSLVDEGTMLTTLSNNREMYAYFNVSEKEYLRIVHQKENAKNSNITLILANGQPHKYKGSIETIDGEFDKSTGNIAFRAKFPNTDALLKHGSSGKIQLNNELKDALIIPQKACFEIQDKYYVFVLDSTNSIRSRKISIKHRLPQLYVIDNGLSNRDRIIYEGIQNVKEGDVVVPKVVSMHEIISNLKIQ